MDAAGLFCVLIGTKTLFCFRSMLHVILKVMPHTAHRRSLLSAARSSNSRRHLACSSTVHVESSDTMCSRKAQCQAPPDNPETGDTYHSRESRSCAGEKIEHQNEYKRYGGSVRVWATASDVFSRAPSRVGRVGRAAVDFVVCFEWGGFLSFFYRFYFFERTLPTASARPPCLKYLSSSTLKWKER